MSEVAEQYSLRDWFAGQALHGMLAGMCGTSPAGYDPELCDEDFEPSEREELSWYKIGDEWRCRADYEAPRSKKPHRLKFNFEQRLARAAYRLADAMVEAAGKTSSPVLCEGAAAR